MAEIAGLKLIVPSSVAGTGVSVSASGKVTFTAATSVSVDGCFSALHDNYLVVIRCVGTTDGTFYMRMRAAGTDASGNNYVDQRLVVDGTSVTSGRQGPQNQWLNFPISGTARGGMHLYFYGPNLAQPTALRSVAMSGQSSAYIRDAALTHSLSTAYDGFSITSNAGTGALTIYGLSQ